ncbi:IPT/TIG domain-containing protein [Winogradskya humida]|uniref:IPT/TIG domain-containing protein n=1 Tax=Winogradskya humida TaxID=113566 RepID=A0ABQ3ZPP5_9ACTN|nr:IPT/TIG domain-containing protein [Actinoplanes humidus]GIE20560.1 hypothetical protein Ahu01nite_036620 [Actinoplanes humidus]
MPRAAARATTTTLAVLLVALITLMTGAHPGFAAAGDEPEEIADTNPHVGGYIASTELQAATPGTAQGIPASVDLRPSAPAVGDQGSVGQCVAWTISRNLMGYYAGRSGGVDTPYAPLFLYMRNVTAGGAPNRGLNPDTVLANVQANGVDSQDDYFQGTSNYKVAPTSSQISNAANYRVTGWTRLWSGANQGANAQTAVQQALAAGTPVAIGFSVFQDFMDLGAHSLYSTTSGTSLGGHMVTAFGYDADGVYLRNQWGTGWGNDGDAHVSWSFIETVVSGAYTISGVSTPSSPVGVTPQVTALSTSKGPAGTSVTITGAGLVKATAVRFGGTSATFSRSTTNGVTRLLATAPVHAGGPADVTVTNPAGTSDSSGTTDDFTFTQSPPTLSGIAPSTTSQAGGATITLSGANLSGGTVKVGTTVVTPATVTDTSITFVAPARTTGNVPITVTTSGGTSSARYLTFVAGSVPTITTLTPSSGASTATTIVVVTGTNLSNIRSVKLGTTTLSYTVVSSTSLKIFVKARPSGAASLVVTTAAGTSNALPWTAVTPTRPAISSLSPATGLTTASTVVTVNGSGFTGATRLSLGGRALSFTRLSATQLRFTAPAHRAGKVNVVVVGPGGTSAGKSFTYATSVAPVMSSLSRTTGSTKSMTTTTVTGRYLSKVTVVTSAGKRASFKRVTDTKMTVTLVRHAAGAVTIQATSAGGRSNGLRFTYVN